MKKAWIVATALVLTALLLTGCDNGNVSGRNDGVVDGTNGTSVATLPTMGEQQRYRRNRKQRRHRWNGLRHNRTITGGQSVTAAFQMCSQSGTEPLCRVNLGKGCTPAPTVFYRTACPASSQ